MLDQVRSLALLHCETTWSMFCGQGLECEDGVQESKTSPRVWDLNGKLGCPSSISQQNAGLALVVFCRGMGSTKPNHRFGSEPIDCREDNSHPQLSNFGNKQYSARARTCAAPYMPIQKGQRHFSWTRGYSSGRRRSPQEVIRDGPLCPHPFLGIHGLCVTATKRLATPVKCHRDLKRSF